jgi:hypothetical protein
MAGPLPLADFVTLGQHLYVLMNPQNAPVVEAEIPQFIKKLESCGLHRTRTAANALTRIEHIPAGGSAGVITHLAEAQLKAYLEPIWNTLYSELGEQVAIAVNIGVVSQQLRQLPASLTLTTTQTDLLNETVNCIECGAYRAGAVMGWNLAYDYIRQWVFGKHLAPFNEKLTTHYLRKDSTPVFERITTYDDFFSGKPDERTVIDTCYLASLFGEKIRDNLRFYLRRRNDYAHPTFTTPSADQTNGYIRDLLDTITSSPFN